MGGKDDAPMWITIEVSGATTGKRLVFVPLARMKEEQRQIRVPYNVQHINSAPEVEAEDELSEEDERALRDYYAIDLADQEMRTDNESYVNRVPEEEGSASKISAEQATGEKLAKRAQEGQKKAHEELEEEADKMNASRKDKSDEEDPRAKRDDGESDEDARESGEDADESGEGDQG